MKKKGVKVTIEELIASIQNNREGIESVKEEIRQKAYNDRLSGVNSNNPEMSVEYQTQRLQKMTREEFDHERMKQAGLLFSAYHDREAVINFSSAPSGKEYVEAVQRQRLDANSVRQVLGKKFGDYYLYSTDILYLNRAAMLMIDAIEWGNDKYGIAFDKEHYDMNKVSPEVFMDIVDELDAIITIMSRKGIVAPDYREITTQTNLIKRALGIAKNENVFGIDDFELNYNEMISKNTSIIRKTYSKIKKAFKEFWNPPKSVEEKKRREPDYLGNQKVEIER